MVKGDLEVDSTARKPRDAILGRIAQARTMLGGTDTLTHFQKWNAAFSYAGQYDGKENPRTETGDGAVPGQTVTLKRLDNHTVERISFLKGKKLVIEKWAISSDGKTRTVTQSGVGTDGKPVDNVLVYEKK